MYRKVKISERLPEEGKPVITIDSKGNAITYTRTETGWNMPVLENNHPMEFWLDEITKDDTSIVVLEKIIEGAISLIKQIEMSEYTETNGHVLTNNRSFIQFKQTMSKFN